jgi:hypothetical protein
LCGYHSYFVRRDMRGRALRPWERLLAEERSSALWAENGQHLPMWIVHGTQDLPVINSDVLIERYEKLKYSIRHDHPDLGHNVWQWTYENLKGIQWLTAQRRDPHPANVRFKTLRTRWGSSAWVTVDELSSDGWGEIDARVLSRTHVKAETRGISALTLSPGEKLIDATGPVTLKLDGDELSFAPGEALIAHKAGDAWTKGPAPSAEARKRGTVTGPLRDVFHDPLLFVYGKDPDDARANEETARALARGRYGMDIDYPVMSDEEFFARNEPLANDRALFLVGRKNRVLAAVEEAAAKRGAPLPIRVREGAVEIGKETLTGRELGAAFIHPNPVRRDRYVVVVAGADVPGMLRATSLPDLLPDFVVWDHRVAPARGHLVLGSASVRAAGFFERDWSLPPRFADPLAKPVAIGAGGAELDARAAR